MGLRLKDSTVNLDGLHYTMLPVLVLAEEIYYTHGQDLVITSAKDGKHSTKSLHYEGKGLDLRTRFFDAETQAKVTTLLKVGLGRDYDVVLEKDHIHIEYDPK